MGKGPVWSITLSWVSLITGNKANCPHAALAGALVSQVGMKYAFAANTKPVSLLLGSHMDYLQALAPAYAEKYGVTPSIETVTTPDLSVKLNSWYPVILIH